MGKRTIKKHINMYNVFLALIAIIILSAIPKIPTWAGAFFVEGPEENTQYKITAGDTQEIRVKSDYPNFFVYVIVSRIFPNDSSTAGVITSISEPDNYNRRTISVTISEPGIYECSIRGAEDEHGIERETIRVYFEVPVDVSVTNDGHGSATADPASCVVTTPVALTATPDNGYRFKEWQVVSGNVTVTNNRFIMPNNNVTIKAIFEKTPAPSSSKDTPTSHTHSYSWVVKTSPTATSDGEEEYVCSSCGHVAETRTISYMEKLEEEIVNQIKIAPANGIITIDMKTMNSLGKDVRDSLVEREDVTLKLSFKSEGHKGIPLKVTIPTGIDRYALWDENGWLGLCRAGSTLGYDKD